MEIKEMLHSVDNGGELVANFVEPEKWANFGEVFERQVLGD